MLSEVDIDLEDLEARLYSQVYHISYEENQQLDNSTQETDSCNIPDNHSTQRTDNCNIPDNQSGTRYYKIVNFANQNQQTRSNTNNTSLFIPSINRFNANPHLLSGTPLIDNLRKVPPLVPQVINVLNPFNNIVVLPQATPHFLRTNALQPYINKNLEKFLKRQNLRLKRAMRRKVQKERRRSGKLNASLNEPHFQPAILRMGPRHDQSNKLFEAKEYANIPTEIIDESDSDNGSCIVIKDENSLIVLSSDESVDGDKPRSKKKLRNLENVSNNRIENKNFEASKNEVDDDVIFIEPKPVEVIEIDVDLPQSVVNLNAKSVADADASKLQDAETSSSNSTDKARTKQGMTSKERRELLNTPDSTTSNDFLVNPLEAPHTRFNFGLHDSDFSNSQIFLKPKSHADAYETESSCSTSDISSTPIKTALFNEVEFETPAKQLFDDTNLEGFGNYITPNRSIPSILTTDFEQVNTRVSKAKRGILVDTDSSSESDFDSNKVSYLDAKKAKQALPNLCPIDLNYVPKGKTNKIKKKKISNSLDEESPVKQGGNKRKSNFEASDEDKNETQKKSKNKNDKEQNQFDGVSDSARKTNQSASKRNKSKKDFNAGNQTKEIAVKDAGVTDNIEETNVKDKQEEIKNALVEDCTDIKDQAITINSDTEEVEFIENKAESSGVVVESTLENMVSKNFIILDETADEEDSNDGSSIISFQGDFSDFEEIADDLTLANCESRAQHTAQSDVPKKRTKFADYWIADSEKFHNRSWGLENFSVEDTQKSMSDDPDLWKIVDRDRVFVRLNVPRGQRCRRCREIGHVAFKCKNKPAIPSCTLCGEKGHHEARCPNALCTTCGYGGNYSTYCSNCAYWKNFQCKICKAFGHFDWGCPDLWRRYHLTTKPGPIVVPEKSRGKLFQDKWCCSCAKFGHYEQNCRYANRTHFPTVSEIKEYFDVYNFPKSQPTITLSESIDENKRKVEESCVRQEKSKQVEEATNSNNIQMRVSNESDVIVVNETDDGDQNKVTYPPEHMIPLYFQQQLSYLKVGEMTATESTSKSENISNTSALIVDSSLNLEKETKVNLNSSEIHSKRILLLAHKYAYLHSCRGQEFINKIKARSNVNVIIKRSAPDAAEVGVVNLHGSEKEVDAINNEFSTFLHDVSTINIRVIPKDSDLLYTFLFKALRQLRFTQGNSKVLLDSILIKKQKLFASGNKDWRSKPAILTMYHRLNILLFGRCKLEHGKKHLAKLESWLESTKNKHFVVTLSDRFDIYEAYMYIYKSLRSDDEYASFCENVNYHIGVEKPNAVDGMSRKQRLHFSKKIKEIIKNCKKNNLKDELRQVTNIQAAVYKSDFSRSSYQDFLRYFSYFTKYFCNSRNSKI